MANLQTLNVNGDLDITGTYSPPLSGTVIATHFFSATSSDISGSSVTIIPTNTITVSEGSRLYIYADSGQISKNSTNTNPRLEIRVNGNKINKDDNHKWYGGSNIARVFLYVHAYSSPLSAGSVDIRLDASVYNGSYTFNYQGLGRSATMFVMEIAE